MKKTVASLLTLTMLLGVAPFTVFAAPDAETAAEQALEERVFEIGGEQLTIEDLEQADVVLITTVDGENSAVPGSEIRSVILNAANSSIATFPAGTIDFDLTRTTSMHVNIKITIKLTNSAKTNRIEGLVFARDTGGDTYYFRYPYPVEYDKLVPGEIWSGSPTSSVTLTFNNITMKQYAGGEIGIMFPIIHYAYGQGSYNNSNGVIKTTFYL